MRTGIRPLGFDLGFSSPSAVQRRRESSLSVPDRSFAPSLSPPLHPSRADSRDNWFVLPALVALGLGRVSGFFLSAEWS